jgi:hypothetical protein
MFLEVRFECETKSEYVMPPGYKIGEGVPFEVREKSRIHTPVFFVHIKGYILPNFLKRTERTFGFSQTSSFNFHTETSFDPIDKQRFIANGNITSSVINAQVIIRFLDNLLDQTETDFETNLSFDKKNMEQFLTALVRHRFLDEEKRKKYLARIDALPEKKEQLKAAHTIALQQKAMEQQIETLRNMLIKHINLYMNSRGLIDQKNNIILNWITRLFRNTELTTEKMKLANDSWKKIQQAKTVTDFSDIIQETDSAHTALDKKYGKSIWSFFTKSHFKTAIDKMSDTVKNSTIQAGI